MPAAERIDARKLFFCASCFVFLLASGPACGREGGNGSEAPKQMAPSAASAPATPPPAPTPPPPNSEDIPAPPDVKAPPADAEKTASGLASKVLKSGAGTEHPTAADTVQVHYTGWQSSDGRMFDSSVKRGQPARFPLDHVIKGWTEGVQLMTVGEKRRFWIPASLAYGDKGAGGRPSGMLVFDIELLGIASPPKTPEDVAAVPKGAKKTKSGISYLVLKKGTGKNHPKADSTVEVNYSGWTTEGKLFDSSVSRGIPATFPLGGVIPGWTEGVQLMVVGEKTRFWIPGNLAYDNSPRPDAPKGTLVFDIELLAIK